MQPEEYSGGAALSSAKLDAAAYRGSYLFDRRIDRKDPRKDRLLSGMLMDSSSPGASLLDIGTGAGTFAIAAARRGFDVTAIDASPESLELAAVRAREAGQQIHLFLGDARQLDFRDRCYDAAVLSNVLEHFDESDAAQVVAELHRILRPGGVAVVAVPCRTPMTLAKYCVRRAFDPYFWTHSGEVIDDCGDITHRQWFTTRRLHECLCSGGLEVFDIRYFLYRTAQWPRGRIAHAIQRVLDRLDSRNLIKALLAFGIAAFVRRPYESADQS